MKITRPCSPHHLFQRALATLFVLGIALATVVAAAEEPGENRRASTSYEEVLSALVDALGSEEEAVRAVSVRTTRGFLAALKESGDADAAAALRLALRNAPIPALQAYAAYALGVVEDGAATDDLRSTMNSAEPEVRLAAAQALRALGEVVELALINPYENVDWKNIDYHDANLHTHTNFSDGRYDPHYAIDRYHDLKYEVLALTDHDSLHVDVWPKALYPWTELNAIYHEIKDQPSRRFGGTYGEVANEEWQNRDPDQLGMVSIPGSEISRTHHIGSLFNHYAGGTQSEETAFQEIGSRGGLAIFFHPGRYDRETEWYVEYYRRHEHVVGMEVYNQVDRYPVDRRKWDSVLYRLMPERPVWGFANDDTHTDAHFGRNRNVFLLTQLTKDQVFDAMRNGHFTFFVPVEQGVPPSIRFTSIEAVDDTIRLNIEGDFERIEWITYNPFTEESETVAEGAEFSLSALSLPVPFVRAVVICEQGRTYTQPFGVRIP